MSKDIEIIKTRPITKLFVFFHSNRPIFVKILSGKKDRKPENKQEAGKRTFSGIFNISSSLLNPSIYMLSFVTTAYLDNLFNFLLQSSKQFRVKKLVDCNTQTIA